MKGILQSAQASEARCDARMRAIALVAALCLLTTLVPAPAEAHYDSCFVEDVKCIIECERRHLTTPAPHGCAIYGGAAA